MSETRFESKKSALPDAGSVRCGEFMRDVLPYEDGESVRVHPLEMLLIEACVVGARLRSCEGGRFCFFPRYLPPCGDLMTPDQYISETR